MSFRKNRVFRGNDLVLGKDETGKLIVMPHSARRGHMYIVGRTRSGKSRSLLGKSAQDIAEWHARGSNVLVIDPHDELCNTVITRLAKGKAYRPKAKETAERSVRGKKGRRRG